MRIVKHLTVTNSILEAWVKCPRKAYLSYLQPKQVTGGSQPSTLALDIGTCVHAALEAHYRGNSIGDAINDTHARLGLPEEGKGCIAHIDVMVNDYLKSVPALNVFAVEERVEMPIDDKVNFAGTLDLVVEEEDGSLTLVDHKTTSDLYKYLRPKVDFSHQFTAYRELLSHKYPDRKINEDVYIHGIQTAIAKGRPKPKTFIYKTIRDDFMTQEWYDWARHWSGQIVEALELKSEIVANMGNVCIEYNSVCPFADYCRGIEADLETTVSDYKGGSVVWEK